MTKGLLPWERQPAETDEAWNGFQAYRDQEKPRSMTRLASDLVGTLGEPGVGKRGRPPGIHDRRYKGSSVNVTRQLERWSSIHHWLDRARAWDNELDRRAREVQASEVMRSRKRHAQHAQALMEAGMAPAIELVKRIKDQNIVLAEMNAVDLYKLTIAFSRVFPGLVNAERVSRGEPAVEMETPVQPSDLQVSDKHLMELWAVLEDLGETPIPPTTDASAILQPPDQQ